MKYLFVTIALALTIASCGGPKEDSPSLKEAKEVHNRMVGIASEMKDILKHKMTEYESRFAPIAAKGDSALAKADSLVAIRLGKFSDRLFWVQTSLEEWESNLVGIPGEEHDHSHAEGEHTHDHSHSHEANPELTDEQQLELQKELESQILILRDSLMQINLQVSDSTNVD